MVAELPTENHQSLESQIVCKMYYISYINCITLLPGKSHEQRSLAGYSPRGRKESDMTEPLSTTDLTRTWLIFLDLDKRWQSETRQGPIV